MVAGLELFAVITQVSMAGLGSECAVLQISSWAEYGPTLWDIYYTCSYWVKGKFSKII